MLAQPRNDAVIRRSRPPGEPLFAPIQPFDVELLAGLDAVAAPDLGGQDDWPLEDTVVFMRL